MINILKWIFKNGKYIVITILIIITIMIILFFIRDKRNIKSSYSNSIITYENKIDSMRVIIDTLRLKVFTDYTNNKNRQKEIEIKYIIKESNANKDNYIKLDTINRVINFRKWILDSSGINTK